MQQMLNTEVAYAALILDIRMPPVCVAATLLSELSKKLHGGMIC